MALANYTDLQQAVQNWAERADLSIFVPDVITLGEGWINRNVPIRQSWTDLAMTCATSSRNPTTFPTDFLEPGALFLTTFGTRTLLTPFASGTYEVGTFNGTPRRWAINGANIDLDVPCNQTHSFLFRYRKAWTLSVGAPTNAMLTAHPDLYLSSCLVEMYGIATEGADTDKELTKWVAKRNSIGAEIAELHARSVAVAPLGVEDGLLGASSYNIFTDE